MTSGVAAGQLTSRDVARLGPPDTALGERYVTWRGKRLVDLLLSLGLLVVTLPLMVFIALAVKLTSDGPVLFRQRRVGRDRHDFFILKFRTMQSDAPEQLQADAELREIFLTHDHKLPCDLDPRLTPVGRALRRLSLDELPQLFNVVAGHMSLVGPRPVVPAELERDYRGFESAYLLLRPGLTGLWQVSGRSTVKFPARAELDSRYAEGCGPWLDAKILVRTPLVVLSGIGAQ